MIERLTAEAMHAADRKVIAPVAGLLDAKVRTHLDAIVDDKAHARRSRLSWLREPPSRVSGDAMSEILDKLACLRATGAPTLPLDDAYRPRLTQMAREGLRLTAQAFQQMGAARRYPMLVTTLRELEATLTDAAIGMFGSLVGRANFRARKRLEETIALSADQGGERLMRIADVLAAVTKAAKKGKDIVTAVAKVAALDVIGADVALIRWTTRPGRSDVIGELLPEYWVLKQVGPRFPAAFVFEGRTSSAPLRAAMAVLAELGGDRRKPLPADVPSGHIVRHWHGHLIDGGAVNRTYWGLATYFALAAALTSGDIWVPTSRLHRSLDVLLAPTFDAIAKTQVRLPVVPATSAAEWLDARAAEVDAALLDVASGIGNNRVLFTGDRLRFPKEKRADDDKADPAKAFAARCYGLLPTTRITDVLTQVDRWTGFTGHFGHVSTGLPPDDDRAFLAALIAEATNLGLSRMAEVCTVASRRALIRLQTWQMREDTFRGALPCLTDAIHAEPL